RGVGWLPAARSTARAAMGTTGATGPGDGGPPGVGGSAGVRCSAIQVAASPLKARRRTPSISAFSPVVRLTRTTFCVGRRAVADRTPATFGGADGLAMNAHHFESCEKVTLPPNPKPPGPPPPRAPRAADGELVLLVAPGLPDDPLAVALGRADAAGEPLPVVGELAAAGAAPPGDVVHVDRPRLDRGGLQPRQRLPRLGAVPLKGGDL